MKALRSSLLLLALACLPVLALPRLATAQEDATIEAARERFKEGVTYFDNREFERARLAFVQAYALKPHPAVLLNLAQSELRSGHEAEAATHFARYLREHAEATEEQRAAAREGLEAAKQVVGVVTLTVDQSGAEILVDGVSQGRSPLDDPLYLTPGEHTIVAQKGGETDKATVLVSAGSSASETLKVAAAPAPAAAASVPKSDEARAEDEDAEEPHLAADAEESGPSWEVSTPVAIIGAGLTAAAIGTGIGFAVSARSYYDSADEVARDIEAEADRLGEPSAGICLQPPDDRFPPACDLYQERVDTADKYKTYATISFIAGGALGVGTLVYVLVPQFQKGSARAHERTEQARRGVSAQLIPVIGPEHQGLVIQGSF